MFEEHIGEEALELYSMGRLEEPQIHQIEEHLLLCEACQGRLEEMDEFIQAFRIAARDAVSAPAASSGRIRWRDMVFGWRPLRLAGALAFAAVALVVLVPRPDAPPRLEQLELRAVRGVAPPAAVSGSELELALDLDGLPLLATLRVEIVDAAGARQWVGEVPGGAPQRTVRPGVLTRSGSYWVRVYGAGSLLREFPLAIRR